MFWINSVSKLLKALNADTSPNAVAGAFVLGATIGLLPKSNLSTLILFLITWVIRVNVGIVFLAIALFALVGPLFDPVAEPIGFWLLTRIPFLQGFWTALYNLPLFAYFSFNNTLVLGNLILAALLAMPIFYTARRGIVAYRARYRDRVLRSRVMTALLASRIYGYYRRMTEPR